MAKPASLLSTETPHTGGYCNTLLVTHRCASYCHNKLVIIIHGQRNTLLGAPFKGVQMVCGQRSTLLGSRCAWRCCYSCAVFCVQCLRSSSLRSQSQALLPALQS